MSIYGPVCLSVPLHALSHCPYGIVCHHQLSTWLSVILSWSPCVPSLYVSMYQSLSLFSLRDLSVNYFFELSFFSDWLFLPVYSPFCVMLSSWCYWNLTNCIQQIRLWDEFTVTEHMNLFVQLRRLQQGKLSLKDKDLTHEVKARLGVRCSLSLSLTHNISLPSTDTHS